MVLTRSQRKPRGSTTTDSSESKASSAKPAPTPKKRGRASKKEASPVAIEPIVISDEEDVVPASAPPKNSDSNQIDETAPTPSSPKAPEQNIESSSRELTNDIEASDETLLKDSNDELKNSRVIEASLAAQPDPVASPTTTPVRRSSRLTRKSFKLIPKKETEPVLVLPADVSLTQISPKAIKPATEQASTEAVAASPTVDVAPAVAEIAEETSNNEGTLGSVNEASEEAVTNLGITEESKPTDSDKFNFPAQEDITTLVEANPNIDDDQAALAGELAPKSPIKQAPEEQSPIRPTQEVHSGLETSDESALLATTENPNIIVQPDLSEISLIQIDTVTSTISTEPSTSIPSQQSLISHQKQATDSFVFSSSTSIAIIDQSITTSQIDSKSSNDSTLNKEDSVSILDPNHSLTVPVEGSTPESSDLPKIPKTTEDKEFDSMPGNYTNAASTSASAQIIETKADSTLAEQASAEEVTSLALGHSAEELSHDQPIVPTPIIPDEPEATVSQIKSSELEGDSADLDVAASTSASAQIIETKADSTLAEQAPAEEVTSLALGHSAEELSQNQPIVPTPIIPDEPEATVSQIKSSELEGDSADLDVAASALDHIASTSEVLDQKELDVEAMQIEEKLHTSPNRRKRQGDQKDSSPSFTDSVGAPSRSETPKKKLRTITTDEEVLISISTLDESASPTKASLAASPHSEETITASADKHTDSLSPVSSSDEPQKETPQVITPSNNLREETTTSNSPTASKTDGVIAAKGKLKKKSQQNDVRSKQRSSTRFSVSDINPDQTSPNNKASIDTKKMLKGHTTAKFKVSDLARPTQVSSQSTTVDIQCGARFAVTDLSSSDNDLNSDDGEASISTAKFTVTDLREKSQSPTTTKQTSPSKSSGARFQFTKGPKADCSAVEAHDPMDPALAKLLNALSDDDSDTEDLPVLPIAPLTGFKNNNNLGDDGSVDSGDDGENESSSSEDSDGDDDAIENSYLKDSTDDDDDDDQAKLAELLAQARTEADSVSPLKKSTPKMKQLLQKFKPRYGDIIKDKLYFTQMLQKGGLGKNLAPKKPTQINLESTSILVGDRTKMEADGEKENPSGLQRALDLARKEGLSKLVINPIVDGPAQPKRKNKGDKSEKANSGPQWFNMPAAKMTPDLKADMELIKLRGVIDKKRFYNGNNKMFATPFLQRGTIIEDKSEFYSSRLARKDRKSTLVDEILHDGSLIPNLKKRVTNTHIERAGYYKDDPRGAHKKPKKPIKIKKFKKPLH